MEYKEKYEIGSNVTAERTYNGEIITGEFGGFYLLDKSNPKSIVGIVRTPCCSYDVEPNSIKPVISEDEKIRKELIKVFEEKVQHGFEWKDGIPNNAVLAWLEKRVEQKPVDKVEPKFKNGQWIVWQDKCYKVNYNGCGYELVDQNGLSTSLEYGTIDENAHLWDIIQDAKDGDVLAAHECLVLFKEIDGWNIKCNCTYHYMNYAKFYVNTLHNKTAFYPATKEQRDLLFSKMKEAGYEWDAEKRELKKIDAREILPLDGNLTEADCKVVEQKPTWSEEDESMYIRTLGILGTCYMGELPTEVEEEFYWLKSIKERYTWKPGNEQMEALNDAVRLYKSTHFDSQHHKIESLYEDLKKLKNE